MLNLNDPGFMHPKEFYNDYEMPLAHAFYAINQRGITVDASKLASLRDYINDQLRESCSKVSSTLGGTLVIPSLPVLPSGRKAKTPPNSLNLSSPDQIIECLKTLGLKPPKVRRASGNFTESSNEEALNEMFAETGNPVLKEVLRVRELNKILGTNVNCQLFNNVLYGAYFVTGTVTGRRSCRENFLGLGSNLQNQPKHSDLGKRYRECLVARVGKIFIECDQSSAEDWIIQGIITDISKDRSGLEDLVKGSRHEKLACFIFSLPVDKIRYDVERYLAKKVRYAGSYDMGDYRFAQVMAGEGFVVPQANCQYMLEQFHAFEPKIRRVFQQYVIDQLTQYRQLATPFGRIRQFMALRDYGDNKKVFKEGYAQIPQSTVGDNTGLAILWLELYRPGFALMDGHDSVVGEVSDDIESVIHGVAGIKEAFNRIIRFPNGLEITIPIDISIGYDLEHVKKCADLSRTGLIRTYQLLNEHRSRPATTTTGTLQAS